MTLAATEVLEVHLFGTPRLESNGTALVMPTKRALGLVAYLALEGATSREKLANLLWDELFFENPKRNLRQELYRLSHTPLAAFLEIGDVIKLDCRCDARLANEKHHLIDGDFMLRFEVPQASNFNQWLQMQRETFAKLRLGYLEKEAASLTGLAALNGWLEVLQLDGLREAAICQILRLETQFIGLQAARERYLDFKERLKSELGLEPLPETQELAKELGLSQSVTQPKSDVRIERMLEAASLLTQPFEAHLLLDITGLTDFEVLESLEKAAQMGLLQRSNSGFELAQAASVARNIPAARRKILERRIAKRLGILGFAPQIIAWHLEQAGELNKATEKYLEAAELAARQDQVQTAMDDYNKVLTLSTLPDQRFMVLQTRVILARRLDNRIWRETIRDLEHEARNRSPEHRVAADLQRALWHMVNNEFDKAFEFVASHLEKTGKLGGMAAYLQGSLLMKTGQLLNAESHLRRALAHKNALEDQQTAEVHNVLCVLATQRGQMQEAKKHNLASLKGFARSGHQMGLSRALSTAGVLEMLGGQHRAAMRMFKRSLATSQKIGDAIGQIATLLNLSKSTFETNQFELSHGYLEQGLVLLEQHPNEDLRGSYLVNIAVVERTGLRLDSAWNRVETALELAKTQGLSQKIASRSLIMADLATERSWFEKTKMYLALAAQYITPELQADFILETAKLELYQGQPLKTLELLLNLECQNDNTQYRAALIGLAYLGLGQPLETLKFVETQTQTIYLPLLQAARIKAHAALGTLKENHFEPLPNKQSMPYMRYLLLQAFGKQQPRFKKEALKLEKILGKSPFNKPE